MRFNNAKPIATAFQKLTEFQSELASERTNSMLNIQWVYHPMFSRIGEQSSCKQKERKKEKKKKIIIIIIIAIIMKRKKERQKKETKIQHAKDRKEKFTSGVLFWLYQKN